MSLLNIPIPNLLNGVSQQPPNLRFPGQAEVQENAYSSIVEGLGKRPPSEHIAKLINGSAGPAKVHMIDRGDGIERYVVVLRDNSIKVFDLNGVEKTVIVPSGAETYLDIAGTPETVFKCVSIADYTFILNTEKTPALDATTSAAAANEALVWVKQGAYNTRYEIKGNFTSTWTSENSSTHTGTVDGESFSAVSHADGVYLAARLRANLTSPADGTSTRSSYVLHLTRSSAFNISVSDGIGGNALGLVKGSVQAFTDLPTIAPNGFKVNVEGLPDTDVDDYWLTFQSKNGSSIGEGTWAETVAPGVKYKYDYSTMPHVLIRQSDGTFIFKRADGLTPSGSGSGYPAGRDYSGAKWADRLAGDEVTNPTPSFVGRQISDIFLFRGRLGVLAGESVILSESGFYFNFWRTSVSKLLDSDPIDISSSHPSITLFRHAIPFSDRLVLFSDRVQFILGTRQAILTSTNVVLTPTANYDCLNTLRPVVIGDAIFFGFDRGGYTGVRQMIANTSDSEILLAPDISAHVPKYINGKIVEMVGSSHDNILVVLSSGDLSSLFIYKWYDSGQERIQSSWSTWNFAGSTIRGMSWIGSTLYVVIQRGSEGLFLEKITVEPNRKDIYSQFVVALDRRIGLMPTSSGGSPNASYNSSTDTTTITLPYTVGNGSVMNAVKQAMQIGGTNVEGGYGLNVESASGTSLVVSGNWIGTLLWIGEQYTMRYQLSKPYLKQSDGSRMTSLASGRFQIKAMQLSYSNSSSFKTTVTHEFSGTQYEYQWSGNILGTGQSIIANVPVESGVYRFPVYGKNTEMVVEIQNSSPLPSYFLSAEVEGTYDSRSRRV